MLHLCPLLSWLCRLLYSALRLNESQQVDLDLYDKGDETASERFNVSLSNTQEGLLRVVLLSLIVSVCTGAVVIADVIAGLI